MRYLFYLRVSGDEQDEMTQLDYILPHVQSRDKDYIDYMIFRDKITTKKYYDKRPGMNAMLKEMKRGDIIVVIRADRLARSIREGTDLIDKFKRAKVGFVSVEEPNLKSPLHLAISFGMAEEEIKLIRKRTAEKLGRKRNLGERISHQVPYGYKIDPDILIPIKDRDGKKYTMKPGKLIEEPTEQEVLKLMLEMSNRGLSYYKIGVELEKLGYLSRKQTQFHPMSISRILHRIDPAKQHSLSLEESKLALFQ